MRKFLLVLLFATSIHAQTIAIKAARMIDGTGAAPIANAVVVIDDDKITAVGSNLAIPAGRS